ncbi:MAG: GNAT family N-acetyltransferase [Methanomassiliicoccaceae archaeon]|jgi:ribosomal protein S18 acetylase RimI-like enzyme|nr:GNAT family N-acetyltransferase [Methanomassiliicoccaceae archaeon]
MKKTTDGVAIRKAELTDFDDVYPLMEQLWADWNLDKERLERVFAGEVSDSRSFMFCALNGQKVVGFIAGYITKNFYHAGTFAYITTLVIDKPYRGSHIGTRLLDTVVEYTRRNGGRAVELDANFHRQASHEFYEHYGFTKRAFTFTMEL